MHLLFTKFWHIEKILLLLTLTSCTSIQHVENEAIASAPALTLATVTSFDVYRDKTKLHLIVTGTATPNDPTTKVYYVQSDDDGQHWTTPVAINTSAAPMATRGNDIQLAAADNQLLAAWQTQGELPGMGALVSAYSLDGGQTWNNGSNPAANSHTDQAHLDLVADTQGVFHAVWLEDPEENGYQSVRYAQSNQTGRAWNALTTVDNSTCSCCWNVLKESPSHELNLLYRDMEPRDMALSQLSDHGKTWQRASTVGQFNWTFDGCPHIGGALAFSDVPHPALHSLVWTGAEQKQGLYYLHSDNNGKTWQTPRRMGQKALHGDIAANQSQIAAVWDEMSMDGTQIFIAQSTDSGATWSSPRRLSAKESSATHPRIVANATGFLALWTEKAPKQPSQLGLALINALIK